MTESADPAVLPIVAACGAVWQADAQNCRANCSGYVKQVAARVGVYLPDLQADGIIDYLSLAEGWQKLGNDAKQASHMAGQGAFVVAGLKAAGNGHVAVVVPGWSAQGFPLGYWGSMRGAQYAGAGKSLTLSWTKPDLERVAYFAAAMSDTAAA